MYQPLEAGEFRLLRFIKCDQKLGGQIGCHLEAFPIHCAPAYDALSYVWNDTHPAMSSSNITSNESTRTILCNGQEIEIGFSLHGALVALKVAPANNAVSTMEAGEVHSQGSWERLSSSSKQYLEDGIYSVGNKRVAWPSRETLRDGEKLETYIWIDALCINQNDIQERGKQVAMMRDIYRYAKCTAATSRTRRGRHPRSCSNLDAFSKAYNTYQKHHDVPPGTPKPPFLSLCQAVSNFLALEQDEDSLKSGANFFNRKWFTRVWILQEVAVAERVRMFYGGYEIDHNAVALSASWLFCTGFDFEGDPDSGYSMLPFNHAAYICGKLCSSRNEPETTLAELILRTLYFDATNPRDKIFALLGISAEKYLESVLRPDYKIPVRDVYIAATKHILQNTQNLDILSGVFHSANPSSSGHSSCSLEDCDVDQTEALNLPSWVPNLSHIEYSAAHHFMSGLWCCGFQAGGAIPAEIQPFRPEDPETLRLSGVTIDRISFAAPLPVGDWVRWVIGWPCDWYREDVTGPFLKMALHMLEAICRYYYPEEDCGCFNGSVVKGMSKHSIWKNFESKTGVQYHRTGESLLVALTLTACAGQTYSGESAKDSKDWMADCREYWERHMGEYEHQHKKRKRPPRRHALFEKSLSRAAWGRRLFLTSGGLIGLGPKDLLEDDVVTVIYGAKTPFILRSTDQGMHSLVGEAYVHGIMAGEGIEGNMVGAGSEVFEIA